MIKYLISTILIVNSIFAVAQVNPLDTLFQGGSETYNQILRAKLRTPISSMKEGVYGMGILGIRMSPSGEVKLELLTHIDQAIDQTMVIGAQAISSGWLKKGKAFALYQPVIFGPAGLNEHMQKSITQFDELFNYPVLEPIYVLAFVTTEVRTTSYNSTSSGATTTTGTRAASSNGPAFPKPSNLDRLEKKISKHIEKEKNEKAYEALNEYLRYNPFDKAKLQERNRIEGLLGLSTYKTFDFNWFKTLNRLGY